MLNTKKLASRAIGKGFKIACCLALATVAVPMQASPASAQSIGAGNEFTVNNFVFKVTAGLNVQLVGVESQSAVPAVCTVPATVTYGDETHSDSDYKVVGVSSTAFRNCTTLEDLRIPDLGTGKVFTAAFSGCTNLKTIHMLGAGSFSYTGTEGVEDFSGVGDLNLVFHNQTFKFNTQGDYNKYTVTFPANTKAYYALSFKQGDATKTVYVNGLSSNDGTVTTSATPASLIDPTSVSVYCDAALGADSLCPEASVPSLEGSNDAWQVKNSDGELVHASSAINSSGEAVAVDSKDLSTAAATAADLYANGTVLTPQVTVVSAAGKTLAEGVDYEISITLDGKEVAQVIDGMDDGDSKDDDGDMAYQVTATGTGSYFGTCSCSMTVYDPSAWWCRACGTDRYQSASAIASKGQAISAQAYLDINGATGYVSGVTKLTTERGNHAWGYVDNSTRVVVNPDDFASCLVGTSLAGLYGSTIVSVPADLEAGTLSASIKAQLSAARNGSALVVGSVSSVSENECDAIADITNGGASRVSGKATTPAAIAVNAYNFVRKVEDGTYSMSLPDSYASYGKTALVVPASSTDTALFSAAAWAYSNKAPIFFCNADGMVDADTAAALLGTDGTGARYFTNVVTLNASSDQLSALRGQLANTEVTTWEGGDDEYAESLSYVNSTVAAGTASYGVMVLARANEDWGCLACGACTAGVHGGSFLLRDFVNDPEGSLASIKSFAYKIGYGVFAGGYDDLPQSSYEEIERLWDLRSLAGYENLRFATISLKSNTLAATGKAVAPQVTVTDSAGNVLPEGKEGAYTLSYIDNSTNRVISADELTNAGTYTVTATGTQYSVNVGWVGQQLYEVYGTYNNTRSAVFTVTLGAAKVASAKSTAAGTLQVTAGAVGASKVRLAYKATSSSSWTYKDAESNKAVVLSKLKSGTAYQVKAAGLSNDGTVGAWSAVKTVSTLCAAPAIKSAKAKGHRVLAVTWAKVTGASSYQVRYKVGKGAWKTKTFKKTSVKLSKLRSGKKYKVQVRAKNAAGWSAWSKVKTSAKVK